jgi:hypothetical protein
MTSEATYLAGSLVVAQVPVVWVVLTIVFALAALLVIFSVVRFAIRFFRGEEELETGSSMGQQLSDAARRERE